MVSLLVRAAHWHRFMEEEQGSSAAVVDTSWQPDRVERAPTNWKKRIQLRLFDCISALPPAANNAHYSRASDDQSREWSSGGGSKRQDRAGQSQDAQRWEGWHFLALCGILTALEGSLLSTDISILPPQAAQRQKSRISEPFFF